LVDKREGKDVAIMDMEVESVEDREGSEVGTAGVLERHTAKAIQFWWSRVRVVAGGAAGGRSDEGVS